MTWSEKPCILITIKDNTAEKIIDQKEVLEKISNMVFKSYTHELTTPLNGICLSLGTLELITKKLIQGLYEKDQMNINSQLAEQIKNAKLINTQLKVMNSCSILLKSTMHDFFDHNQL